MSIRDYQIRPLHNKNLNIHHYLKTDTFKATTNNSSYKRLHKEHITIF